MVESASQEGGGRSSRRIGQKNVQQLNLRHISRNSPSNDRPRWVGARRLHIVLEGVWGEGVEGSTSRPEEGSETAAEEDSKEGFQSLTLELFEERALERPPSRWIGARLLSAWKARELWTPPLARAPLAPSAAALEGKACGAGIRRGRLEARRIKRRR